MKKWVPVVIVLLSVALAVPAQTPSPARSGASADLAPLEVAITYGALRTNAPPGSCGCLWMQGGQAEFSAPILSSLSIAGELAGEHTTNINSAHEDLSLITYLLGARYTLPMRGTIQPFAQALIGGVRGFDAIFPGPNNSTTAPDSFATTLGGGINIVLSRRIALRALDASYLQTHLPNDANNRQNSLRLSAGIVFRFGISAAADHR